MKRFIIVLIVFVAVSIVDTMAQDVIVRRNPSQTIICKVLEVGDQYVKYVNSEFGSELTFTIDRSNIVSITFGEGKKVEFEDSMFGPSNYESQRHSALKFSFFSPLIGATSFSYEKSIKPGQSFELGAGIIGLGVTDETVDPKGFLLRAGYKFSTTPTFTDGRSRFSHLLKGAYFKPELVYSSYKYDGDRYSWDGSGSNIYTDRRSVDMLSIMIVGGKQWVFADAFLIDIFFGLGYGIGSDPDEHSLHYGFSGGNSDFPLTATMGLKVGFLLGKKR